MFICRVGFGRHKGSSKSSRFISLLEDVVGARLHDEGVKYRDELAIDLSIPIIEQSEMFVCNSNVFKRIRLRNKNFNIL